jgi:threonine dehydrogenase-like Zn-dependent dehydrogenase
MEEKNKKMKGAILPGNSTVELKEFEIPKPGRGQVRIRMKASTICGSDIRCSYHEHVGKGPEGYQPGTIAGHEPAGQIIKTGEGMKRFKEGDRVAVYHISGCGVCNDCREGYMISCTSDERRAYGWQRDGGMAEYLLAEEKDLVPIPDGLTYSDAAQAACGLGTAYEALRGMNVSGADSVLVVGLGPLGQGAMMLAKAMGAKKTIGVHSTPYRLGIAREKNIGDELLLYEGALERIMEETDGRGVEKALDCSGGSDLARQLAIKATGRKGHVGLIGEGGDLTLGDVSKYIIHPQKTITGYWVTSSHLMEELLFNLKEWNLHPEDLITHRFSLDDVGEAYSLMASGKCGKVAVVFDEELR